MHCPRGCSSSGYRQPSAQGVIGDRGLYLAADRLVIAQSSLSVPLTRWRCSWAEQLLPRLEFCKRLYTDAQPEVGPPNTDAQPEVCAPMIDAEPESARPLQRKSRRTGLCQTWRRLRAAVNTTIAAKLEVVLYARSLPSASAVEKLCMLKWPDRLKSRQLVHWRAACDKYQWERMTQKDRSVWPEPLDWWMRDVCNLKSEKSKSKMQALFPEPCLEELEWQIVAVTMGQSAVTSRAETISHKEIRQTASHIATCYNDVIAKQIAEKTAARLQVLRDFEEGDGASAGVCTVDLWPSLPPDPWGGCLPPPMC